MQFKLGLPRIRERYYLLGLKEPDQKQELEDYPLIFLHDKRKDEYIILKNNAPIEIPRGTMMEETTTGFLKTGWVKGLRFVGKNMYHPSQPTIPDDGLEKIPDDITGYIPEQEFDNETKKSLKKL